MLVNVASKNSRFCLMASLVWDDLNGLLRLHTRYYIEEGTQKEFLENTPSLKKVVLFVLLKNEMGNITACGDLLRA